MDEPQPQPQKETRAQLVVRGALRGRVTIALSALAVLASLVSLLKTSVSAETVGAVLAFVALLLFLGQIAGRSFLMQLEQHGMLEKTELAAHELAIIRRNTEEELRAEQMQNQRLELLLTAMRAFNLIEVDSLKALSRSWPTTSFYLQRHATTIVEILKGRWDRSEFLRPEQLWREYKELLTQMRDGETFRSTVCVPSEPALLFDDKVFNEYVDAIYEAASLQKVEVKRLFVLDCEDWPPHKDSLEPKVLEHLRALAKVASSASALKARVTSEKIAKEHFHMGPPDFMMWGDGLLISSDLNGPDGLVTRAVFDFASDGYSAEILKRRKEFDALFADSKKVLPLGDVI